MKPVFQGQLKPLYLAIAVSTLSLTLVTAERTQAATVSNQSTIQINIPAGSLSQSLALYTQQTGVQVVAPASVTANKQSSSVSGAYSPEHGLAQLLSGTGLTVRFVSDKTAILTEASAEQTVIGAVQVEGSLQAAAATGGLGGLDSADLSSLTGASGSRDLTATENNKSYARGNVSVGGNRPIDAKKVTQSISTVNSQTIEDSQASTIGEALKNATGVYVQTTVDNQISFISRAEEIKNITVDGVSSISQRPQYEPTDVSLYDHVELLRGGDAFFNSGAEASTSGSINLVRKKPLDHQQSLVTVSGGSWNTWRQSVDLTGPLNQSASLRGRAIVTNQTTDNFWRNGDEDRVLADAQIEYDLTPTTTVNLGAYAQRTKSVPWGSLPRSDSNSDLNLPRDFSTALNGVNNTVNLQEVYFGLDHTFNENWSFNLKGNYKSGDTNANVATLFFSSILPSATNTVRFYGTEVDSDLTAKNLSASLLGKFNFLDRNHTVELAASYANEKSPQTTVYGYSGMTAYQFNDLASVDFSSIALPAISAEDRLDASREEYGVTQKAAYLKFDFQLLDNLHFLTGPRWISIKRADTDDKAHDDTNVPYYALRYDFKNWSVYSSYADLYEIQAHYKTANDLKLKPQEGNTIEIGTKYSNDSHSLTFSAALFKTKLKNQIEPDFANWDFVGSYPYKQSDNLRKKKGIELELSGAITPYWQSIFGYTYTDSEEILANQAAENLGVGNTTVNGDVPKHNVKWTNAFTLSGNDYLTRTTLGFDISYFSKQSKYDTRYTPTWQEEVVYADQGAYSLANAFARYQINNNWNAQLNVYNIFDENYYGTLGGRTGNSRYGAPRSFQLAFQGKF